MKAGVAVVDITPQGPVWMDGMLRAHRSTGVHDPIFAKAVALSGGDRPSDCYVMVSVNVCNLSAADGGRARSLAAQATGIPAEQIVIAATHTHSGPAAHGSLETKETAYVDGLVRKLAEVIQAAVSRLEPAAIGCASGREDTISHYRRLLADDGRVVMNWEPFPAERIVKPLGVIDPEVGVLKIVAAQQPDRLIGLVFNHAGHPNVLSGDNYLISADYPGLAERILEKEFGCPAVFFNGAQGTMDIDGLRDRDWAGLERVGKALASAVSRTVATIAPSPKAAIRGACVSYTVPARKISAAEIQWAEAILARTGGSVKPVADGVGDDYKAGLLKRLRAVERNPLPVDQVCLALDGTAFLSFPGELFTEIGMRIKAGSPFSRTFILGLANGATGYVPTRKAIQEGGYESDTRRTDDEAEDIVTRQSLALLRQVHGLK